MTLKHKKMELSNQKIDFSRNIKVFAEIQDLEELGWDFDTDYESVAKAQGISEVEAEKYNKENYSIEITVNEEGETFSRFVHNSKQVDFDNEPTGDDEQTIKDLIELNNEEKLWNIEKI